VELREFNGESDHVHLLVNYPPKVRLSELVNSLKGVSSRLLKQEFPDIHSFWLVRKSRGVLWTPSYFAGSVGGAHLAKQLVGVPDGLVLLQNLVERRATTFSRQGNTPAVSLPRGKCLGPQEPVRSSGGEMTRDGERVVGGCMHRYELAS
jgi:hypothetical protein